MRTTDSNYAGQFPGESLSGDYLPPEEGALDSYTPAMYVVIVMRPTGVYTFNKMTAFLIAHLAIFSPGAKLRNWPDILDGAPQTAVTVSGYQYNLEGELQPVPRQFYNDRYFPPPPLRIESQKGELLSTIQFLPWQDGGVLLLKGKLPLEAFTVFLGKEATERGGFVHRPPDLKISHVLPITQANFNQMLNRFQQQSNMVVRRGEEECILQKFADEGSTSPFIARVLMGVMRLRDVVYSGPAERGKFDKPYELVTSSLMNTRTTAKEIAELWEEHARKVASGEIARRQGRAIHIDESIDKELRKEVESFLNSAVRALKQGMQDLGSELQVSIGFLFKQQGAFETGISALQATDPLLGEYLRHTRTWSERLVESRNAIEHQGWTLPHLKYAHTGTGITATEPEVSGQPVTEFVKFVLDRLCCFVEEFTAHCPAAANACGNHHHGNSTWQEIDGTTGALQSDAWDRGPAAVAYRIPRLFIRRLFRVFSGWPTGSRLLHPADPTSPAVTSEPKRRPRNPQIPYTPVRSWATRKGNKTLINRELSL